MGTVARFEQLGAWQTAREIARAVYGLSNEAAFARDFGLRDQMRRAAVSILSNIAEGFESQTQALFIRYLGYAKGSAGELRAQLYIALEQGYVSDDEFRSTLSLAELCSKQITRLIQYLETQPNARRVREDGASYDV